MAAQSLQNPAAQAKNLVVNLDTFHVISCPTSHQILMILSSKENLITSYYLHCFHLGPHHFSPRLSKQHSKWSSCLCPSIEILKSAARVMLLKICIKSCHSSVQNPPTALHLTQSKSRMMIDLYLVFASKVVAKKGPYSL